MADHYLFSLSGGYAIAGPMSSQEVVNIINAMIDKSGIEFASQFCNASRYWLAKNNYYPKTKSGDAKLSATIEQNSVFFRIINESFGGKDSINGG